MTVEFEAITNRIGVLVQNDTDIQNFSNTYLGGPLTVQDNTIVMKDKLPPLPSVEINKDEEISLKNDEAAQMKKSNIWAGNMVFFADFGIDDATSEIPAVAIETINGILTYKPSDLMRILARKVGELCYNKIACSNSTQGIYMSNYKVLSETYYDRSSGVVGSYLDFEFYKRNTAYN